MGVLSKSEITLSERHPLNLFVTFLLVFYDNYLSWNLFYFIFFFSIVRSCCQYPSIYENRLPSHVI